MSIRGLNHFTVMSTDLEATRRFYAEALQMEVGPRPAMGFPGLWLYAAGEPVLHVIAVEEAAASRNTVIDHVAFSAVGLRETVARFNALGLKHRYKRSAEGGWQFFCRDPDGATIELDFPAEEEAPTS